MSAPAALIWCTFMHRTTHPCLPELVCVRVGRSTVMVHAAAMSLTHL